MFLLYHYEGCDIYGTVFYGCHVNDYSVLQMQWYAGSPQQLLGLQVQRFVEQQQVSLKWITQGVSNSGRKWSKVFPLKQPCNQDTRSLLCPQHTQYTCQMYRCTSLAKI